MQENNVQNEFNSLIKLLLEVDLITKEQHDALNEFISESLPFYQNNDRLNHEIAEISAELASVITPNMSHLDAQRNVSPQLVQRIIDLPKVEIKLDSLKNEDLSDDERILPLIGIGLLKTLGGKKVSHNGSMALLPTLLARLSYSRDTLLQLARVTGRDANRQVSNFFAKTKEKIIEIPMAIKHNVLSSASRTAHSILTSEYQTAGTLADMLNIYEFGRCFYLDQYESVFVFSNTSGLVIPNEHMGAIDDENIRTGYFDDALIGTGAKTMIRYYQWDRTGTSKTLYKNFLVAEQEGWGDSYILQSKQLLAKFLQEKNLEITEAEFGSLGGGIKYLIPIVGRGGVMFSNRHPVSKKMAYANLLTGIARDVFLCDTLSQFTSKEIISAWSPTILKSTHTDQALTYSEAIKEYIYGIEITCRIKGINQVLDYHVASEIVDQLLDCGKQKMQQADVSQLE